MNKILIWAIIILAIVVIGIGAYFALTNNDQPTNTTNNNVKGVVNIKNSTFDPATITVNKGDTVTWQNNDSSTHHVAAEDGSFSLNDMPPGGSSSYQFNQAGTFKYYCTIHTYMKGTVVVK